MMTSLKVPLLSIVIPVYNRQESLDVLLSVLLKAMLPKELYSMIEIIVIDDFSEHCIEIQDLPCSTILKRNEKNMGAPSSREKGFHKSQGLFVHFHDSDDSVADNWLSSILLELKRNPETDILMTARIDRDYEGDTVRVQKYFHAHTLQPSKIKSRLVYRNCMGPLGGITFSRRVLMKTRFLNYASCQDWQMYLDAINYSDNLLSLKDVYFLFNKRGSDRISLNARKKLLGHAQLSKITAKESVFKKNIRFFYLFTCKKHIVNKGGGIYKLYKEKFLKIFLIYVVISLYWRLF